MAAFLATFTRKYLALLVTFTRTVAEENSEYNRRRFASFRSFLKNNYLQLGTVLSFSALHHIRFDLF